VEAGNLLVLQPEGEQEQFGSMVSWTLLAKRSPLLDACNVIPTFALGRGALLVRKASKVGEDVVVFCHVGDREPGSSGKLKRSSKNGPLNH
jgi:hypothetical protein